MSRLLVAALLSTALLSPVAHAQTDGQPDAELGKRLKALGYDYDIDDDGDYRLLFGLEPDEDGGKKRSQVTYVRSVVEQYGNIKVREILSPAYRSPTKELSAEVANELLQDSQDAILGGWVRQGNAAVFVVKVDADLDGPALSDAIEATTRAADQMEAKLTDGKDDF